MTIHCEICNVDLTDKPMDQVFRGETLVRTTCTDCSDLKAMIDYVKTGVITTQVMMSAILVDSTLGKQVMKSVHRIQGAVKVFEQIVWFDGYREVPSAAHFNGIHMDYSTMGGWFCIHLDWDGVEIAMITDDSEDEAVMGVQGLIGKEEEILKLISEAIQFWLLETNDHA